MKKYLWYLLMCNFRSSFPLEMQMIHYENQMINSIGKINFNKAHKSAHGVAILSILFHVDEDKPQVNQQLTVCTILIFNDRFIKINSLFQLLNLI